MRDRGSERTASSESRPPLCAHLSTDRDVDASPDSTPIAGVGFSPGPGRGGDYQPHRALRAIHIDPCGAESSTGMTPSRRAPQQAFATITDGSMFSAPNVLAWKGTAA